MDIIGPNGEPMKTEPGKVVQADDPKDVNPKPATEEPPREPAAPCTWAIDTDTGIMTFTANLKWIAESGSAKEYFAFMGYMEQKRNEAAAIIQAMREQIAQQKAKLLKIKNKGLFNGFLDKLRR